MMATKTLLVTGGLGFVLSNFIEYFHKKYPDWQIINIDNGTYAARRKPEDLPAKTYYLDVANNNHIWDMIGALSDKGIQPDIVLSGAAETHVDNSIKDPSLFAMTNVVGTTNMLELCKELKPRRSIFVETDEIYGPADKEQIKPFEEETTLWEKVTLGGMYKSLGNTTVMSPSSPYSASKAGASLMVDAFRKTYGIDLIQVRPTNMYGEFQHNEKLIPTLIRSCIKNEPMKLYGDGRQLRDWMYVEDFCRALDLICFSDNVPNKINVSPQLEYENIEVARRIKELMPFSSSEIEFITDRPAHDVRYFISNDRIKALGWEPQVSLNEGIKRTVAHEISKLSQ